MENQRDPSHKGPRVKKDALRIKIGKAAKGNKGDRGDKSGKEGKEKEVGVENGEQRRGRRLTEEADVATGATSEGSEDASDPGIPDFGEGPNGAAYGGGTDGTDDYNPTQDHTYGMNRYAGYGGGDGLTNTVGDDEYSFYGGGMGGMGGGFNESEYIFVDPHVLASATLADVNGDGHMELIIPVSYYFEKESRESREGGGGDGSSTSGEHGENFDYGGYVAGGIVCWDLVAQDWAWTVREYGLSLELWILLCDLYCCHVPCLLVH